MPPIVLPATVEPVNETLSTPGWLTRCSPTSRPAGTTLSTPLGRPASSNISARRRASSGVSGAGLNTTVQPATSDGPSLAAAMNSGTFQGLMAPTTPTGSLATSTSPMRPWRTSSNCEGGGQAHVVVEDHGGGEDLGHGRPGHRRSHLGGDQLRPSAPSRPGGRPTPWSRWRPARSGPCGARGPRRRPCGRRPRPGRCRPWWRRGPRPTTSSVVGLITSIVPVPAGDTHSPPMNNRS